MNEQIIKNLRDIILNIENLKINYGKTDWITATGEQQAYRSCITNMMRNDVADILDKKAKIQKLSNLLEAEIDDGKERNKYWLIGWHNAIDNLRFKQEKF